MTACISPANQLHVQIIPRSAPARAKLEPREKVIPPSKVSAPFHCRKIDTTPARHAVRSVVASEKTLLVDTPCSGIEDIQLRVLFVLYMQPKQQHISTLSNDVT